MKRQFRKIIGNILGFQDEIDELRSRINELSWDSVFGMWTRTAFLQFCRVMPRGQRTVVFIDLDRIHSLNHSHGYTEVDRMVREAFAIPLRQSDIVARWYSGDEIVILFDNDRSSALMKIQELERSAARQGLSFTHETGVWDVGSTDIVEVVNDLSTRNKRKQECREADCESRL
jgi:diguanylate cyclase (GGDEF)-like protein